MKYKIEYIATFHADVLRVVDFLEEHPQKAARIFAKLDNILGNLTKMPEMYPVYDNFSAFRKITIEDYLVFYAVKKQAGVIEVHRLINARMDVIRCLNDN